jgi:hypothetical protein
MKRLAVLFAALAPLALASTASAYTTFSPFSQVSGNGAFGNPANSFSIFAVRGEPFTATTPVSGSLSITGTDANGTHSYTASLTCFDVDSFGVFAGMLYLIDQSSKVGQPAALFAVLVNVSDPEPQFTRLSQHCAWAPGRAALTGGNITIEKGNPPPPFILI